MEPTDQTITIHESISVDPISVNIVEKYQKETSDLIHTIYEKYRDNPYMLSKTHHLLCNQLTNMLDNIWKTHEQNQQRFEEMSIEKDAFIDSFLNTYSYFYNTSTEKFFFYNGLHYQNFKEDDILYNILSTISRDRQLMCWKQKTKVNIMKRIKDNNILKSVPESDTIQHVLDLLYPLFFSSKNEAKHFLTILGDSILKKTDQVIHFIKPVSKNFIRSLNEFSNFYFGANVYNSFRYKYHEHEYVNCRIIMIQDCIKTESLWKQMLDNYALDILCVSAHYSSRYTSADEFITNHCNESALIEKVFYLRDRTYTDMVQQFILSYLQMPRSRGGSLGQDPLLPSVDSSMNQENTETSTIIMVNQISWKTMQFLWKHYLDSLNLPSIMFQQTLKLLLTDNLQDYYSLEDDSFKGIFSKYLPFIQKFLQFWEESIIVDPTETDFEFEELTGVFKKWCELRNESYIPINDRQIIDIISYYYPNVIIDQEKYINHIRCTLWDKQMDIQIAVDTMRDRLHIQYLAMNTMFTENSPTLYNNTSIYDIYVEYCKYFSSDQEGRNHLIVSKSYFDKNIIDNYSQYVIDNMMLSYLWYM